jgi:N-acylneuraminate cytidylyltransferase
MDAGQFYWGTLAAWELELPIFSSKSTVVELPFQAAVDIDTIEDWHIAEDLFRLKRGFNEKPV